jgi:hypothetical protein
MLSIPSTTVLYCAKGVPAATSAFNLFCSLGARLAVQLYVVLPQRLQAFLDYLAECLTSPANPTTVDQLNEFKMTSHYFPDIKQAIDKVERVFADKEDLRRAIMLAAAYDIIERLIR